MQESKATAPASSQDSNIAVVADSQVTHTQTPSVSTSAVLPSSIERVPDSQPQPSNGSDGALPTPLALLLNSIKSTVKTYFMLEPPHTVQRLAELILQPNKHYRTLPAFLRAVDRVVSVTSSASLFPFSAQSPSSNAQQPNGIVNGGLGTSFMAAEASIGADDSLGGALLTPIPWLSHSSVEDNNGLMMTDGKVPPSPMFMSMRPSSHCFRTLTLVLSSTLFCPFLGGISELASTQDTAQESSPISDLAASTQDGMVEGADSAAANSTQPPESPEEIPRARGPPVIGVEDLGLQDGKDVEMTLAEPEAATQSSRPANEDVPQDEINANGDGEGDRDIALDDVGEGADVLDTSRSSQDTAENGSSY